MKPFQAMTGRREDNRRRDEWGEPQIPVNGWRGRLPSGLPVTYSGLILLACIVVFFISIIFPDFRIQLPGFKSRLCNAKALDAHNTYVRACRLQPPLLEYALSLLLWHGAGKARGREKIPADLHFLRDSGGVGPDDDIQRLHGGSERSSLSV